jgi:hypothetical protein
MCFWTLHRQNHIEFSSHNVSDPRLTQRYFDRRIVTAVNVPMSQSVH